METEIKRDSAGRFLKGSPPNPLGRPKSDKTIRDLARVHTKDALKTLSEIVKDPMASRYSKSPSL